MEKLDVILTMGIPASGKTTWAKNQEGYVLVNRDDLRMSMFGKLSGLSNKEEKLVTETQIRMVNAAMGFRKNVIIHDTNLNFKTQYMWAKIVQLKSTHQLSFKMFDIDLQEALKRNSSREKYVPDAIIVNMYKKYVAKGFPINPNISVDKTDEDTYVATGLVMDDQYQPNISLTPAYVFDIDGTLAENTSGRSWYEYSEVYKDTVHTEVLRVLNALRAQGNQIIIVSGRKDDCIKETTKWLKDNHIHYDQLYMRKWTDNRPDDITKMEIFNTYIKDSYYIKGWFDDRASVSRVVFERGIPLFRVGHPDWIF